MLFRSGLPCRLTIVDAEGALAALPPPTMNTEELAVRPGVLYARAGAAWVGVLPGQYTVYASRGFEYSVATQTVSVAVGETKSLAFAIRRVVPTRGWVASDTHIHTLTLSKHGDATDDERALTIAGEGIELAVATEHNHHAD